MKLMKRISLFLGLFFSIWTLTAQRIDLGTAITHSDKASLESAIRKSERIITKLLHKNRIPGIAITVTKNGETLWQQGYGFADMAAKKPVDPQKTLFRVASISKAISATGLGKMMEDSLLSIDSSFYKYVPYFPRKKYDFTLRQLGGHLAGIRNYKGDEFLNNKPMTIREGIGFFENDSLLFEPGTRYLYSSYNWNLLSLAMEAASGVPFEIYMKEKVLTPLQMSHTIPDVSDSIPNKAVCYSPNGKQNLRLAATVNNYYKLAGGGYLSTSEDIARLGNAYLNGEFLSKEVVTELLTSQLVNGTEPTYYGIGWQVSYDAKNRPFYGHKGSGVGGYAFLYVYPAQQMVFALLLNVTDPGADEELQAIIDSVLEVDTGAH